jgi:uncharacterized protein (DUF1800 family)
MWCTAIAAVVAMAAGVGPAAAQAPPDRAAQEQALKKVAEAREVVIRAEEEKSAAEKAVQQKDTALTSAATACAAAKAAADRAAREADEARAAMERASVDARAAAEKTAKAKAAAAQTAAEKFGAAKAAVERAAADKKAAEAAVCQKEEAIRAALPALAAARCAAYGGLTPLPESAWDYAKARHLLYRAGFGGTPEEVERLHAMGLHRAVEYLVRYQKIAEPDVPFTARAPERPEPYERKLSAAEQNKLTQRRQAREAEQLQGIRNWWLRRMAESPRPLEEKLTLFWHGHFASEYQTIENSYLMFRQQQMFRAHANGNFGALLRGLMHDPTMLRYLNNDTNVKGHANENLAREIMELFAMGLDQGYTEKDIREAARALTGYTFDYPSGEFRFVAARRDDGPKTIFGKTGNYTGDDLVDLILQQPATPRFIARKLFTFFAYENPDSQTVDHLAGVLRANNYEIAPMLENLFLSQEFYGSRAMGTQIKGPVQLVIGAVRELGLKEVNYTALSQSTRMMGQDLLQPPNVKGWDGGRTWVNANRIFLRYNAVADLLEGTRRGGERPSVDVVVLLAGKKLQTTTEVVDYLTRCCLAAPPGPAKRQTLIDYLGPLPPPEEWPSHRQEVNARLTALLVALLSSPEYQLT